MIWMLPGRGLYCSIKDLFQQSKIDGSAHDVKHIMDTWTLQMNFPTVFIERTGQNLRLSQSRYLLDKNATDPGTYTSPFG